MYSYYLLELYGNNNEEHMEFTYTEEDWLTAYREYKKCVKEKHPCVLLRKVTHNLCGAITYKVCKIKIAGGKASE